MGHGGLTLKGAIRYSLLCIVDDRWVGMWHFGLIVIGEI